MLVFRKRDSSMFGLRESASGAVGRSVFRLADGGAGLSARSEVLRHGENAADVSERLNSTLHFLSMWHQESGAKKFAQQFGPTHAKMRFVDHHLAHAISAYAYSGFDEAAVVVMDGRGAWEATTIWHGHNGRLEPVLMIPFPDSVGYFYSACTEFLGFQPNSDEWKVDGAGALRQAGCGFVRIH